MSRKKSVRRRSIGGSDAEHSVPSSSAVAVDVLRSSTSETACCCSSSSSSGCSAADSRKCCPSSTPLHLVSDLCRTVDARTCYSLPRRQLQSSKQLNGWYGEADISTKPSSIGDCVVKSDNYSAAMSSVRHRHRHQPTSTRTTATASNSSSSSSWCIWNSRLFSLPSWLCCLLMLTSLFRIAESCSSRSTPKPQPPSATMRPNVTYHTYACPPDYATWYCLNGATCFTVTIGESILYNCECADGYMGQRCEFKDLDQSYLPSRDQVMVETASIAGGVTVAVLLIVIISISISVYCRRRSKIKPIIMSGVKEENLQLKPFRSRASFSSSIRMSTTMYSSPKEPQPDHKIPTNSKMEQPNSTSA